MLCPRNFLLNANKNNYPNTDNEHSPHRRDGEKHQNRNSTSIKDNEKHQNRNILQNPHRFKDYDTYQNTCNLNKHSNDDSQNGFNFNFQVKNEHNLRHQMPYGIPTKHLPLVKQEVDRLAIKEDSVYTEVMCETLVDNLKDEICRVTHNSRDENYLEVEDVKKNIEKEFYLDVREEYFEG